MSTPREIIQKNRAICEFMGWRFKEVEPDYYHAIHNGEIITDNFEVVS